MKKRETNWKSIGQEISDLVHRIHVLSPDHRDPHHFHEEKSEIAYELNILAKRVS